MFRSPRKNIVYLLILIIPFLIFFARSQALFSFKAQIFDMFSGPISFFSFPFKEIKKMVFYHRTFDEYKRLRSENDTIKARLIGMEEMMLENVRLQRLLEFKRKQIYSSIAARVVGRNPSNWNAGMIIDQGSLSGIQVGMPVVSGLGVAGKIVEVGKNSAKVILLTDPQFSVAALVQRPRESGLVTGTLQGAARMRYINENADIRIGDNVITSKLSTSFPEGLLLGEIVTIEENPRASSIECLIKPAVSLSQIEEVLVILTGEGQE